MSQLDKSSERDLNPHSSFPLWVYLPLNYLNSVTVRGGDVYDDYTTNTMGEIGFEPMTAGL